MLVERRVTQDEANGGSHDGFARESMVLRPLLDIPLPLNWSVAREAPRVEQGDLCPGLRDGIASKPRTLDGERGEENFP